jgi:hypothetical protein
MSRPRVLISTDIGANDKDDAQSLVHALLYSDKVDYRGFVVTRTDDGGKVKGKPTDGKAIIREIIDAYEEDLPSLRSHSAGFPDADVLRAKIATGSVDGSFPGRLSDGARLIIEEAREASPADPLWVLSWGPIHDAAAALLAAPDIVPNVKLYSIAGLGQDTAQPQAFNALRSAVARDPDYEDLFWIDSATSFRGMMVDANGNKVKGINDSFGWVRNNVDGHGALGELYFEKFARNVTDNAAANAYSGIKMGDSPSLLYLLDAAPDGNPAAASWGGSFRRDPIGENTWTDRTEKALKLGGYEGAETVYEHRDAVRADFAKRLDWADEARDGRGGPGGVSGPGAPGQGQVRPPAQTEQTVEPDSRGRVMVDADRVDAGETTRVAGLDLDEGDKIVFRDFDRGSFEGIGGGNPLQVNRDGTFAKIDSVADLVELVEASANVSAAVDHAAGELRLAVAHHGGTLTIVLEQYGRAFAQAEDMLM